MISKKKNYIFLLTLYINIENFIIKYVYYNFIKNYKLII
uniref:Uncharacterized protein n=1 Tax=viral metagenome TaxID=1070528 RepID=A0A6C0H849_9ZZZZ